MVRASDIGPARPLAEELIHSHWQPDILGRTTMPKSLLEIPNRHTTACGETPAINVSDPKVYLGYFENPFGEQWVFTYDRSTQVGELRGGDAGWNTMNVVENGAVTGLTLGTDEAAWLRTCWNASSHR